MTKKHLLLMSAIAALAIIVAFFAAAVPHHDAHAETANPKQSTGTLTVSAQGEVGAAADIVRLQVGVETEQDTAERAIAANSKKMQDVVSTLKAMGIDEADMQTSRFSVSPVYDQARDNQRKLVGFRAENRVAIVIRDADITGRLIDKTVAAGANRVHDVNFEISDQSQLEDEAMRLAIRRAESKAEAAAEESGVQIVGIKEINISDSRGPVAPRVYTEFAQDADTPIVSGETTVSVQVNVVFKTAD